MRTVIIPKALAQEGELVLIPRKEYEALLRLKKVREFQPTATQKRALAIAQRNLKKGKTLTYGAFAQALGVTD